MFQMEMVSLEDLVPANHQYRKFRSTWNWEIINHQLETLKSPTCQGYGVSRLFSCLLLQFMEDLSDRELERYLQENNASKWFCNFSLTEKTPDHSIFSRFRSKVGTEKLAELFSLLKSQLQEKGLMNEAFSVVDATHLNLALKCKTPYEALKQWKKGCGTVPKKSTFDFSFFSTIRKLPRWLGMGFTQFIFY